MSYAFCPVKRVGLPPREVCLCCNRPWDEHTDDEMDYCGEIANQWADVAPDYDYAEVEE